MKLHDALVPYFRLQIQSNRAKNISDTEQILPVLPSKISAQNEDELTRRLHELEKYMGQVLDLMSG